MKKSIAIVLLFLFVVITTPAFAQSGVASRCTLLPPSTHFKRITPGYPVKRVIPQYPAVAKSFGVEGSVYVDVTISPEGEVVNVSLTNGHKFLKTAAIESVRKWRFQPTLLDGQPTQATGRIEFQFILNQ